MKVFIIIYFTLLPLVYSSNISGPEHHRDSRLTQNFEKYKELLGVYKTDFENAPYVRPVYTAPPLAYQIGVLAKFIPYIPHLTTDPARDRYSQKYQEYDAQLPEHVLTNQKYESLIVSRIAKEIQ